MKLAAVLGFPVSHSRSPKLHGFWLKEYNIDGAYIPLAVAPQDLLSTLQLLPKIGFSGVNLTLPHKEAAFRFCEELGVVDALAKRIGAVNTLVFAEGKIVKAMNTDGLGFIAHLKQSAPRWKASASNVVVLGSGGAARGIVAALIDAGVPSITLLNRTREKAIALAADFENVTVGEWEKAGEALATAGLLINTTSLGMEGQPPLELSLNDLPKEAIVADIVYQPLITDLLRRASARGNPTVDGLGMLLHQAAPGFAAWFGTKPEVTAELRHAVLHV